MAAANGHQEVAALLLSNGAYIDKQNNNGWTPLFKAAHEGHCDIAALLLSNGADIDKQSNKGTTPLYMAAQKGHQEVVVLLLSNGAASFVLPPHWNVTVEELQE